MSPGMFPLASPETGLARFRVRGGSKHRRYGVSFLRVSGVSAPSRMRECMCAETPMSSHHALLAAASMAFLLPFPNAHAGEDLGTFVVTATRRPIDAGDALAPVIIIERDEIERSLAIDVAELLRFHAGVEISRNGGPGQVTSAFIRGADSDHTLVLIDGVRVNPGTAGGAALQNISPDVVERIEIVKGPRSALHGSEAIGGVVNILTRRGPDGGSFAAAAGGGRYGTRDASVAASWRGAALGAGVSASRSRSDGFPTFHDTAEPRGFDNDTINLWLQGTAGPLALEATHWRAAGNVEYFDFFRAPQDQDFDDHLSRLRASWGEGVWASALTLSRFVDDIEQGELAVVPGDFVRTERRALDWQNDLDLVRGLEITAGAAINREETTGRSFGTPLEGAPGAGEARRDEEAGYVQAGLEAAGQRLVAAGRRTRHETFGSVNTWNLEWGTDITPVLLLRAGTGRGFRAPSSADLYAFGGNPDLEPEVSRSWDVGVAYRPAARQTLAIGLFRTEIDQLIEFVDPDGFEGPAPGRNENIGDARIEGVELGWQRGGEIWDARASIVVQRPEDAATGAPLLKRAEESASLALSRRIGPHEVALQILATGDRRDFGDVVLPGYLLANITGRLQLGPRWVLRVRLENALDRDYELVDGYNTAGRGLYAGLAYNY